MQKDKIHRMFMVKSNLLFGGSLWDIIYTETQEYDREEVVTMRSRVNEELQLHPFFLDSEFSHKPLGFEGDDVNITN
jgi:hypothetical protein